MSPVPEESPGKAPPGEPGKVGWLQTVGSVLASFFGVQSSRNRERDFQGGSAGRFIATGIVATVVFILTLVLLVKFLLRRAGM